MKISGLKEKEKLQLPPMHTMQKIPVDRAHIPTVDDFAKYSHMSVVAENDGFEGEIALLLGSDVSYVTRPLEVRTGGMYEPIAMRTPLGWIPYGVSTSGSAAVATFTERLCRAC